jgi:hypothetical protein
MTRTSPSIQEQTRQLPQIHLNRSQRQLPRSSNSYLRQNGLLVREISGCCLDEDAVQTMRGWRKERELVRRVSRNASMAARFRNPSKKKGVRGLSPKAQMIITDRKTSEEIFLYVSFECDSLSEWLERKKI